MSKKAPVLFALWHCVVMISKMLPVKYLAIFVTFFEQILIENDFGRYLFELHAKLAYCYQPDSRPIINH